MKANYTENALIGLTPWVDIGDVPEEARFVRKIGCPKTRQFEVLELGYSFLVREVPTEANPVPGSHAAVLAMDRVLKAMATDVLKANDKAAAQHD